MKTKYMSADERKAAKRAARKRRKEVMRSFSPRELKAYRNSNKTLRAYAEEIGKYPG